MVTKKDLIVAVLCTFCMTSTLFMMTRTRSSPDIGEYDPWIDLNDDGYIDVFDAVTLSGAAGTSGTPINKTALLLELQSRIDSLNSSLLNLEAHLNTRIVTLETSLVELQSRMSDMEASLVALNLSLNNFFETQSITYNYTFVEYAWMPGNYNWVDIPGMEVQLKLDRVSFTKVTLSGKFLVAASAGYFRILVDESDIAYPSPLSLSPPQTSGTYFLEFYILNMPIGVHTIRIQCHTAYPYPQEAITVEKCILFATNFPNQ